MKLTIRGYEVEITAHSEGSDDTASTMVLLDNIADGCNSASVRMRERNNKFLADLYGDIAVDIYTALSDAGMYTA